MNEPAYDPYAMPPEAIREPPHSLWSALRQIGPGIILAGSIIGTGELLLTTSLGAQYGFVFLWLILLSCVVKVFIQIELGRYAISSGKPTLGAINELPGPRLGAHWLVWWWFIMLLCTVLQLGAMAGGVGQALDMAFPRISPALAHGVADVLPGLSAYIRARPDNPWAAFAAVCAALLLLSGGYHRIELITTFMVASVTAITVICMAALPLTGYPVTMGDIGQGFNLLAFPAAGVAAAFSTFGITGVGASELYAYPYWCLEKGYARYAGAVSTDIEWGHRARGWVRVMYLDAWVSMVVFTVATVAFYFMGATVLYRQHLLPDSKNMIPTLSQMYVPAFGSWTAVLFLLGVWAVLFKTLYVASASNSRLTADFFSLAGFVHFRSAAHRMRWVRILCVLFPLGALALYLLLGNPRLMVIAGGFAQAVTLPVIAAIAVYWRFKRTDPRLAPSRVSDALLWLALIMIVAVAAYALRDSVAHQLWPALRSMVGR